MKRLYSLFLILCIVFGSASIVEAQQEVPVQKTRYVYLWDVTGSIKPKGGKVTDPESGLYNRIYGYLRDDMLSKPDGTEIIVVPFNDNVVDSFEFVVRNGIIKAKDDVKFEDLGSYGANQIEEHYKKFVANKKDRVASKGGYTDIAKSINWAERFISNDYNTIFILLTDGGQEYIDDETIASKGDEARNHLQNAISAFDDKLDGDGVSTFNMLFYVITIEDSYSPREQEMSLSKTRFIHATQNSARLNFCPIKATIAAKNSTISYRDEQFYIAISVAEGMPLPKDLKINVKDGNKIDQTVPVEGGRAKVDCKGVYSLQESTEMTVSLELAADPVVEGDDLMFYVYWLEVETTRIEITITKKFKPAMKVKLI